MSVEKIRVLQDVIEGDLPQSALVPLLDDDENWLRDGIEFIVSQRVQQIAGHKNQFRLRVYEMEPGDEIEHVSAEVPLLDGVTMHTVRGQRPKMKERIIQHTDWLPESDPRFSAPMLMANLRQQFPNAKIAVERQ